MPKKQIIGRGPIGLPFCEGVLVGDTLYLSGAIGFDREAGRVVEGGIAAETRKAIGNLKETLAKAGMDLEDVVKVTVYLRSMEDYQAFNEVYAEYFPKDPPARETVAVSGLALGAAIELSFIAVKQ
ncbi:MAG: RidA family protein [Thermodesulfobacteriota bacterium]